MITTRLLMSGLIALGLALASTGVFAADPHAHAAKVEISLDNGKTVVIEDTEEDMYAAIDRAAERADRALARQLSRSREFTHDKVATLAPADEASDGKDER